MVMRRTALACVAATVLVGASAWAGDRTPPPALDKIPFDLRQSGDFFRAAKWKESLDQLARVEGSLQDMSLDLEKSIGIAGMDEVSFALDELRSALKSKDPGKAEGAFLRFEKKYLDVCESFDFQIHPALQLVQLDFEAASRLSGEKDLAPVERNLSDAFELLPWLESALQRASVETSSLRTFRIAVREGRTAAELGNRDALAASIRTALLQLPDFIFRNLKAATPGNGSRP
jgi:hypothetical protein